MSPGDPVRLKFFIICQIVELAKSERGKSRGLTPANKNFGKWNRLYKYFKGKVVDINGTYCLVKIFKDRSKI